MATKGFDYKSFALDLASQAKELIPKEFQDFQKKYIFDTIQNFSIMSAEAICQDEQVNFNEDQVMFLTQIIAEWSFHKAIDLVRSGILPDYWDTVMKKIAFTIFEVAKQTISQGVDQDEILKLVEHHVKKSYQAAIEELEKRNLINDDIKNNALAQSNIDKMMAEIQAEQERQQQGGQGQASISDNSQVAGTTLTEKSLKLATVALLLKGVQEERVNAILGKISENDAEELREYIEMPDLNRKIDYRGSMKYLQEIKLNLPEPKQISPKRILTKINVLAEKIGKDRLVKMVRDERSNVKDFVRNAVKGEIFELSPRVTYLIIQHLEEKIL